ncbi:hypothetical protein VNO80_31545 [Phaseolus coccineus]|uniref:Uncharacterized protein n=1 Tax=Phaseolus coccineus TaxID=3886 RepID=A0AAN9QA40_PHACN
MLSKSSTMNQGLNHLWLINFGISPKYASLPAHFVLLLPKNHIHVPSFQIIICWLVCSMMLLKKILHSLKTQV